MANISLGALDELIAARKTLHGGDPGAPIKLGDGNWQGLALNKACVVLLSAAIQAYVEEVFLECSEKAFGKAFGPGEQKRYRKTWSRWGNPNPDNITSLFRRLGIDDVFDGLGWQKQNSKTLKENLNKINEIRNDIAHGTPLKINGEPYSLHFEQVIRWQKIAEKFGQKFSPHALGKIQ